MIRYAVVWHQDAQNQLAQLWVEAFDRNAIMQSADAIDAFLAWDAATKGTLVEGDLHKLSVLRCKCSLQ
jgi:hypothetical protein